MRTWSGAASGRCLFFLPLRGSYYARGALYSLAQTLIQLVIIFPKMGKGMWGLELGYMTPVLVTFFGVIWGLATAFWLKFSREGSETREFPCKKAVLTGLAVAPEPWT